VPPPAFGEQDLSRFQLRKCQSGNDCPAQMVDVEADIADVPTLGKRRGEAVSAMSAFMPGNQPQRRSSKSVR
jgi:hypothetical protein